MPPCATFKVAWVPLLSFLQRCLQCVPVFVAAGVCICCVGRCQRSVQRRSNFPIAWNMDLQSRGTM